MTRRLSLLPGAAALAAALSLTPTNARGGDGCPADGCADGGSVPRRGLAILAPVEGPYHFGFGVGGTYGGLLQRRATFIPYYAPASPTPSYVRWRHTDCHGNTLYAPYYRGYCLHGHVRCLPGGWGSPGGVVFGPDPGSNDYGPYSGAPRNENVLVHLGGNGVVPYGTPPTFRTRAPDIIDLLGPCGGPGGPVVTPPDVTDTASQSNKTEEEAPRPRKVPSELPPAGPETGAKAADRKSP